MSSMLRIIPAALVLPFFVLTLLPGCTSFDETVKPLVEHTPPPGYTPPIYMTGTVAADQAATSGSLAAQVWRVNAIPYPDSVQLYVRVYTFEGKLVTGLAPPYYRGASDYRTIWSGLTEQIGDDAPEGRIEQFSVREFSDQDGIPYEIALVLDYSGTMGSSIQGLEAAAKGFIRLKRTQDRIAVVKFDRQPKVAVPATESESDLLGAFRGQGLDGFGTYTALYAAAKMGGEEIASAPADHPRAMVLFTDGEDNSSAMTSGQLYDYCRSTGIPVFTVAFGDVNQTTLTEIATRTGGRFYQCYSTNELSAAFEDIYRSLRNYYVVTYQPPFVPGRHIARLTLNLPGSTQEASTSATYDALTGRIIAVSDVITFGDTVFFDFNRAEIRPEAMAGLRSMVRMMNDNPRLKIEIRGHTDAVGTEARNKTLSADRAQAVRNALIDLGISEGRLRARGFGYLRPIASNETEEGRQKNRRVEFVVIAR